MKLADKHQFQPDPTLLLDWYDIHARDLPWRIPPQKTKQGLRPNPYYIWLSEVMLQQTTVTVVKDYFFKFIQLWPNVKALACADQEDIMKAWAGLGYYSRARNLHKCAQLIVRDYDGQFPKMAKELIKLPGIGPYSSAAIAAIAWQEPVAVVDGNVERVFARLYAIEKPLPKAKEIIRRLKQEILPVERPGDFAQAVMDLGATICTPKRPACFLCPWQNVCRAFKQCEPQSFPIKPAKKIKPTRTGAAFVLRNSTGDIWLEKRPSSGLLASMTQIPTTGWTSNKDGSQKPEDAGLETGLKWIKKGIAKHTFTHFHLNLTIYEAIKSNGFEPNNGWWCNTENLQREALPTIMKKAISFAVRDAFKT